ncbi:MAG: hypothetical protein IJC09_02640 [Clostridia bacterium]|nr:hypothetical protein [Clostridia bacterium]
MKKKIAAFLMSAVMAIGTVPAQPHVFAEDSAADKAEYAYFMNTAEGSAYVWLGETIEGEGLEFFDGQAMGITDSNDPLYNETVVLDGLTARKQYRANSSYFKIDEDLYDADDHNVMFSLVFYDFGPSEGWFYFEYYATDGSIKQVALRKPGTNPGWSVKTICIDDIDLTKKYENGANVRIQNGAYNAFKKLEFINVTRAMRDKQDIKITAMGIELIDELVSLRIIPGNDKRFTNQNLANPCTEYDAQSLKNKIANSGASASASSKTLTQGELVKLYMEAIGLSKNENESWVEAASRYGVTDAMDFFLFDEAQATNYHLISIVHAALTYGGNEGKGLLADLINAGFYDDVDISTVKSETFQTVYYAQPRKLPYERITDNVTGRTYNYINLFGQQMVRGYLDEQGWLPDGSGFVCGSPDGHLYLYDINTQMLTFLDKGDKVTEITGAFVAGNGWVYYTRTEDGIDSIRRVHPRTLVKEKLFDLPRGLGTSLFNVTNDGHYATFETSDKAYVLADRPPNTEPIIRVDLWEGTLEYRYYGFTWGGTTVNHEQINPEYPELIAFSHDYQSPWTASDIYDRCLIMNMETGEVTIYNQGSRDDAGRPAQVITHEVWSANGEHRYFCSWAGDSDMDSGAVPAVVRIDKDGTHRQYYQNPYGNVVHANISGDEKMICADLGTIYLMSTETHQVFPIVKQGPVIGDRNHPYHPHPQVSLVGNLASWGHVHNGVLGVAWIDYTDILENEVAKGGRYPFGDDVLRVSYKGIECESSITTRAGVECATAKAGKEIFFDIKPEVIDTDNGAVKITFDYFDNTDSDIVMTYSKGVEEPNDAWKFFNKTIEIERTNTNKWKTAEIVIDCGNFESIGKFETDFKFLSKQNNAYIANIKIEPIEK